MQSTLVLSVPIGGPGTTVGIDESKFIKIVLGIPHQAEPLSNLPGVANVFNGDKGF